MVLKPNTLHPKPEKNILDCVWHSQRELETLVLTQAGPFAAQYALFITEPLRFGDRDSITVRLFGHLPTTCETLVAWRVFALPLSAEGSWWEVPSVLRCIMYCF